MHTNQHVTCHICGCKMPERLATYNQQGTFYCRDCRSEPDYRTSQMAPRAYLDDIDGLFGSFSYAVLAYENAS